MSVSTGADGFFPFLAEGFPGEGAFAIARAGLGTRTTTLRGRLRDVHLRSGEGQGEDWSIDE